MDNCDQFYNGESVKSEQINAYFRHNDTMSLRNRWRCETTHAAKAKLWSD